MESERPLLRCKKVVSGVRVTAATTDASCCSCVCCDSRVNLMCIAVLLYCCVKGGFAKYWCGRAGARGDGGRGGGTLSEKTCTYFIWGFRKMYRCFLWFRVLLLGMRWLVCASEATLVRWLAAWFRRLCLRVLVLAFNLDIFAFFFFSFHVLPCGWGNFLKGVQEMWGTEPNIYGPSMQ